MYSLQQTSKILSSYHLIISANTYREKNAFTPQKLLLYGHELMTVSTTYLFLYKQNFLNLNFCKKLLVTKCHRTCIFATDHYTLSTCCNIFYGNLSFARIWVLLELSQQFQVDRYKLDQTNTRINNFKNDRCCVIKNCK